MTPAPPPPPTPRPDRVLETGVYVDDLDAARRFYQDLLGLTLISQEPGRHLFFRCGPSLFLVFNPDESAHDSPGPEGGGTIPGHGTRGPGHMAFAISPQTVPVWLDRLEHHGVPIESRVIKPDGRGESIYFRDPAGNSIELATPSIWNIDPA